MPDTLRSRSRYADIEQVREAAMYVAARLTSETSGEIGDAFGHRSGSSIDRAVKKIESGDHAELRAAAEKLLTHACRELLGAEPQDVPAIVVRAAKEAAANPLTAITKIVEHIAEDQGVGFEQIRQLAGQPSDKVREARSVAVYVAMLLGYSDKKIAGFFTGYHDAEKIVAIAKQDVSARIVAKDGGAVKAAITRYRQELLAFRLEPVLPKGAALLEQATMQGSRASAPSEG